MITSKNAIEILNVGLSTGADFAEIYIEQCKSTSISLENGKTDSTSINKTYGAGVRLLKGFSSVYGHTNDVSKNGLIKLARSLAASFSGEQTLVVSKIKNIKVKDIHLRKQPLRETKEEDIIEYLKSADKIMSNYDERIIRTMQSFSHYFKEITIYNSDGKCFKDNKERGRFSLVAVAAEGEKIETSHEAPGASAGFEWFKESVDILALAKNCAEKAILMLSAKECPSGKMMVVIGNAFGGVIFHEACGHALEATSVSKNLSVFSSSLGKQIANPIVTAIDDGTIINGWGSNNIDDEGNKTQKTVLIKNGILNSYLIDNFNGRRMGMKGNGACRRQSYKYEPTSRMSNTYIANGDSTPEEIISSVKLGLYAASLGGGSVNPTTGEFNFSCSEAYIIRDGKVCEPVRGATLIGSASDILMNIDMIGNDLERAQGMCGSCSGSIPTDVGQPTIRVSNITVGGTGGELK